MDIVFTEYLRLLLLKVRTEGSKESYCHIPKKLLQVTACFFYKEIDIDDSFFSNLRDQINESCSNTITNNFNKFVCSNTNSLSNPHAPPEQINSVYSKLLCMCFGDIIEDFLKSDFPSKDYNIYFLDALQNIANVYSKTINSSNNSQDSSLYKFYFYICLCIQGSTTIGVEQLVECFKRIPDNKIIFDEIFNDIYNAIYHQKNFEKDFSDYFHYPKYNYLVCISQFLNILQDYKKDDFSLNDDFMPLLKQSEMKICEYAEQNEEDRGTLLEQLCKAALPEMVAQ